MDIKPAVAVHVGEQEEGGVRSPRIAAGERSVPEPCIGHATSEHSRLGPSRRLEHSRVAANFWVIGERTDERHGALELLRRWLHTDGFQPLREEGDPDAQSTRLVDEQGGVQLERLPQGSGERGIDDASHDAQRKLAPSWIGVEDELASGHRHLGLAGRIRANEIDPDLAGP